MAHIDSAQSGPWSSGSTWTGGVVPGAGDTARIAVNDGHRVTLDIDATVGDYHATDQYALFIDRAGSDAPGFDFNGHTLTCRGSLATSAAADPGYTHAMPAGSRLLFDVPTGVTYELRTATYGGYWTASGTEASPVIIGKTPTSQGDARVGVSPGTGTMSGDGQCDLTWVRFEGMGSADSPALAADVRCTSGIKLQHVRFVDGGMVYIVQHSAAMPILLDDVRMSGTILCTNSDWRQWWGQVGDNGLKIDGDAYDHATRHITGCSFDRAVYLVNGDYFTVSGTVFAVAPVLGAISTPYKAVGPNNIIPVEPVSGTTVKGPIDRSYVIDLKTTGNPHVLYLEYDLTDSVIEAPRAYQTNPDNDFGEVIIGAMAGRRIAGNLALPASEPAGSAGLGTAVGTLIDMQGGSGDGVTVEHNTLVGQMATLVHTGEGGEGVRAGMVAAVRSNLVVQLGGYDPATGIVLAADGAAAPQVYTSQSDPKTDNTVTAADYNSFYKVADPIYNVPHTGATFGAHDVLDADPQFADSTRTLAKWGAVRAGANGTVEGALSALAADPTKAPDLIAWVRAGWKVRNSALLTAAHDGTAMGAVQPTEADPAPIPASNIDLGSTYGQPNDSGTNDPTGTGLTYDASKQQTPDFHGTSLGNGLLSWITQRVDDESAFPTDPRNREFMYAYDDGKNESGALSYPSGGFGTGVFSNDYASAGLGVTVVAGNSTPQVRIIIDHPYEAYPDQSDVDPNATPPNSVLAPIPPDAAVQGWAAHIPPSLPHGGPYSVYVVAWGDGSTVPTTGANAVYAGLDDAGKLHLRVFDYPHTEATTTGPLLYDQDETTFPAGHDAEVASLKAAIPGLLPPHVLTQSERDQVFDWAQTILCPAGTWLPWDPLGGDTHMIVLDRDNMLLYELYKAYKDDDNNWHGGGLAIWDLVSGGGGYRGPGPAHCEPGQTRPFTWTSANAAGTPMFPLAARYDEVNAGAIAHALSANFPGMHCAGRFVWPASHYAGSTGFWDMYEDPPGCEGGLGLPFPFGTRLRLRSDWYEANKANFSPQSRVVVDALRQYGCVLTDIYEGGRGTWRHHLAVSFLLDARWQWAGDIEQLWTIPVRAYEVVQVPFDLTVTPSAPSGKVGEPVTLTVNWAERPGDHVLPGGNALACRVILYQPDPKTYSMGPVVGTVYLTPDQRTATLTHTPTEAGTLIYQVDGPNYGFQGGRSTYTATADPPPDPPPATGWFCLTTSDGKAIYLTS